ncbi:MAG TPA: lamin tail domain-containing protein [Bacteroidales bacterium]|nr:lamin tail domain-containing protein [Bacteroidales bacterium]HRZ47852.1 lamin tail domain-containing protein [Bacteroidales bacterium]
MKKTLLIVAVVFAAISSVSAQCTQLFISEYIEGSNNNKAMEIYNPTANPINLTGYQLVRYSNGGTTPYAVALSGIVPAFGTFVTVLDKTDTTLTGQDTAVFKELLAMADTLLCPDYNVNRMHYFNGDDGVTLELLNGTYLDIIGRIGEDPGTAWTCDTAAGFTDALGGRWMTANHTLIRKPGVKTGITVNPPYFNPCAEWDSLPENTFDHLRWHICDCDPSSVYEYNPAYDAFFYPNPVTGGTFTVKATRIIREVELLNLQGQSLAQMRNPSQRGDMVIRIDERMSKGMIMVRIIFEDQRSIVKRVIIR